MLSDTTNIESLQSYDSDSIDIEYPNLEDSIVITDSNVKDIVIDFSLELDVLICAINHYYSLYQGDTVELINRLSSIYNMTESVKLKRYIYAITLHSRLPFEMRIELGKDMCFMSPTTESYDTLRRLCLQFKSEPRITATLKIEAVSMLFRNENCIDSGKEQFINILNDDSLESKYRYNAISSLGSNFDRWLQSCMINGIKLEKAYTDALLKDLQRVFFWVFLKHDKNTVFYRILAGQWLLVHGFVNHETQDAIIKIAEDVSVEYDLRADATDVLLRYGSDSFREAAQKIIVNLGGSDTKTIYQNAQNAHNKSIEASAMEMLQKLSIYPLLRDDNNDEITFDYVKHRILFNILPKHKKQIEHVLLRIELDYALYTNLAISLKSALVMTYSYIYKYEHQEYFPRLIEELHESYNICSTGIIERIVNSISGCDDFALTISFEEQISANVLGRLNHRIKQLPNVNCLHSRLCDCKEISCYASKVTSNRRRARTIEKCGDCALCLKVDCMHKCGDTKCTWNDDLMELVLEEMLVPSNKPQKRIHFLFIYRLYISEIMEELREEFRNFVDDVSFDLYFRKAMMNYEG